MRDWEEWHDYYGDPSLHFGARLEVVRARLAEALDEQPPGPIRVLSICAGQGHDLFGVLPTHRRREDVTAWMVEREQRNAEVARETAADLGLLNVKVVTGNAADLSIYEAIGAVDVILLCGVLGNISDADAERTIGHLSMLCRPGARVIWTTVRRVGDPGRLHRAAFLRSGFQERRLDVEGLGWHAVGLHRLVGSPAPLVVGEPVFTFLTDDDV